MQFADTFYFLALLNRKDASHAVAAAHGAKPGRIITTEWVLIEVADAMADRTKRRMFIDFYRLLESDADVEIVPSSPKLFADGMKVYAAPTRQGLVPLRLHLLHRHAGPRHCRSPHR